MPVNPAVARTGEPGLNTGQRPDRGIQETAPARDAVSVEIEKSQRSIRRAGST